MMVDGRELVANFPLLDNKGEQTTTRNADNFLSDIFTWPKPR